MKSLGLTTLSLLTLAGVGCDDSNGPSSPTGTQLSEEEGAGLTFMREEEKLARDVYGALASNGAIFDSIRSSEERHFAAVGGLLVTYGLEDPSTGMAAGQFSDPTLQALYGELLTRGAAGSQAALAVGCTIEELDLRDLDAALTSVTHADLRTVYENLALGSRNHLRSFYGTLTAAGGSYAPLYLDQATFDAIVQSPVEHGGP